MPRQAADLEEALKKKGGLTLSQLANYDDLITDALVDRVYFWSTIRKLKAKYYPSRGVQEETVCAILRENAIWERDAQATHKKLMDLPGIAKYHRALKTEDEKEHFERHLRKYINIYLPDCPFEVATTNRYTVTTSEACVKARRTIKRGEMIKFLTGIQVEMTEKEEEELSSRTDFSIVLSSRRKRPSLFLGPARFANHDCDSNARLNTSGAHGIHIVAVKEILPGEEITVTYGEDYFGINNCECLCATCEGMQRNGWDAKGPWLPDDSSDEGSGDEDVDDEKIKAASSSRTKRRSESQVATSRKRKRDQDTQMSNHPHAAIGAPDFVSRTTRPEEYYSPEYLSEDVATSDKKDRGRGDDGANATKRQRFLAHISKTEESEPLSLSANDLLDRCRKRLDAIAERSLSDKKNARSHLRTASAVSSDLDMSLCTPTATATTVGERSDPSSRRHAMVVGTGLLTPPYARGLSRSPERSSGKQHGALATPRYTAGSSRLPVPAIKKERSTSSLRNVVSAFGDKDDIFEVPDETPQPPKRKRGRPRKYPRPEESEDTTDSSISSASQSGDSASSASSHASSATSVDTFTAGNIAHSICEMLVMDAEGTGGRPGCRADSRADDAAGGEHDGSVEDATPVPRTTRRRAQAEAARAEAEAKAAKEATKEERRRGRGPLRKSLRHSPHKHTTSGSRPPIQSIETPEPSTQADEEDWTEDGYHRGPVRKPGDYHLTSQLLATPYHRWIECRNCDEFFVQGEAYLTRIACPRCERHSKLYGYYWPKTDKEGKGDTEERVKDHRTIHRFIDAEDERAERKGRRTLADVIREQSSRLASEELDAREAELGASKRLRSSPGGRRGPGRLTM